MNEKRDELLREIWHTQDVAYDLMEEYDSLQHHYGSQILYQAEAQIIDLIGNYPDITTTRLAELLRKTPSACSQIVKRLKGKGLVEQYRNSQNNREYNLRLTETGELLYKEHASFTAECSFSCRKPTESPPDCCTESGTAG